MLLLMRERCNTHTKNPPDAYNFRANWQREIYAYTATPCPRWARQAPLSMQAGVPIRMRCYQCLQQHMRIYMGLRATWTRS